MDVDLRAVRKLRESAAARSALGPIMETVCASPADLASLRVVCDWIQYKQCHDLFLTGRRQYRAGFYGPGKYDGSVVNWVNGPLLTLVGSRRGFGVEFTPFRQRPGSNIVTLTAQARD